MVTLESIANEFPNLIEPIKGPLERSVQSTCSPKSAGPDRLLFIHGEKYLDAGFKTSCLQYVVPKNCIEKAVELLPEGATLLATPNIQLTKTFVSQRFFPVTANKKPFDGHQIHPSAVVSESAKVHQTAIVGPNAVIGEGVTIGEGTVIGANTVVETNAQVGKNTHIHAQVFIAHHCIIGDDCIIQPQTSIGSAGFGYAQNEKGESFHTPHYGKVIIGNRVEIGAGVFIDRGNLDDSTIGDGTKIDNYCHFGHNLTLGKNNLITAGFISAGSVEIGDYNVFAGRCGVTGHNKLGSGMIVGANTIFTKSHEKPGMWGGYPVQPLKDSLRSLSTLKYLPEMHKNLNKLIKDKE